MIDVVIVENSIAASMEITFVPRETTLLDQFQFISCHSYGQFENLNMCDEAVIHTMTGVFGSCFTELDIELDSTIVEQLESVDIVQKIGAEPIDVVILPMIVTLPFEALGLDCGDVTYALADETLTGIVDLDPTSGLVTIKSVTDTSWVGTHTVLFEAYLGEHDPTGIWKVGLPLTLTVKVEESEVNIEIVEIS